MSIQLLRLRPLLPRISTSTSTSNTSIVNSHFYRYKQYQRFSTSTIRMSPAGKYEYLVTVRDHANTLEKRLAARGDHLSNVKPRVEAGEVVFGGATLAEQPKDGDTAPPQMNGSVMLVKANSEEEVRELLRLDPYTKAGVWDVDNAVITPFRSAVRTAL